MGSPVLARPGQQGAICDPIGATSTAKRWKEKISSRLRSDCEPNTLFGQQMGHPTYLAVEKSLGLYRQCSDTSCWVARIDPDRSIADTAISGKPLASAAGA